jgi:23S rRNA (cytosine1962-C5)-methyltransferase
MTSRFRIATAQETAPPQPVTLRKDLARSIRRGHPWLYRDALQPQSGLGDGEWVEVRTRDGRPLARGFWDSRSSIALRLLESGGPGHRFSDPSALIERRLFDALHHRLERLDSSITNAFRWVHGEADLLPGVHVDVYGSAAVVRFDGAGAKAFYDPLAPRLRSIAEASGLGLATVVERADRSRSSSVDERVVVENGHRFLADLAHGQKGGLFLDQRENRQRIAELAAGKSVLNLFGYTGGFSVYAAAAGAGSTDTVDIAAPAIEAARRNFELNGLSTDNTGFFARDVFEFLEEAVTQDRRWDIVISDPPSFAPNQAALPAARRAYRRLHRLAASVTEPGGLLCAASCSSHFGREDFLRSVEQGARAANREWRLLSIHGAAFDHPVIEAFPEGDYLKFAIGRVT